MHAVTSSSDRLKHPILSSPQTTKEWDEATRHLRKYVDEHFPLESPESQEKCEKVISELSMMLTVQAPAPHTVARAPCSPLRHLTGCGRQFCFARTALPSLTIGLRKIFYHVVPIFCAF